MSEKPSKRISAVARLKELFGQPQHQYRPATQIFLDLNVDKVAADLSLAERGTERGGANRPDSGSPSA